MRAIILGCSGAGKTLFAKELSKKLNIELYHLDMLFWNEDGTHVEQDVFLERQQQVEQNDNWIIDGNYKNTLEDRFKHCDEVFFFDIDVKDCLEGAISRRGKKRDDLPWIEPKEIDEEFKNYILTFGEHSRPLILECLEKYKDKKIHIFKSRIEADEYLEGL